MENVPNTILQPQIPTIKVCKIDWTNVWIVMYGNHTNYRTCYVRISHTARMLKCQCSHPYTSLHRGHANKVKELIEQSNQTVEGLILAGKKPTKPKRKLYDFPLSSHKIPLCLPSETKKVVCNDGILNELFIEELI